MSYGNQFANSWSEECQDEFATFNEDYGLVEMQQLRLDLTLSGY